MKILLTAFYGKYNSSNILINMIETKVDTLLFNGGILINKIEKFGLKINRYRVTNKPQDLKIEKINLNKKEECFNLIEFARKCSWQGSGGYFAELIENNELADSEIVIVAYLNDKIVGFAALVNESCAEGFNESPYLDFLYVDDKYRNKGIATKLVDKIVELAKENYNVLYLVTVSHESFYKKLGFNTIVKSTVEGCINECFIMKKEI